jgi:hypothetical protein
MNQDQTPNPEPTPVPFDISKLIGKTTHLETYKTYGAGPLGSIYTQFATKGKTVAAISVTATKQDKVMVNKEEQTVIGLTLRIISIGGQDFKNSFGGRSGSESFRNSAGERVEGFRCCKHFLPLTTYPTSGSQLHTYAGTVASPQLAQWISEGVEKIEGQMTVDSVELMSLIMSCLMQVPDQAIELFHLPGQKASWMPAPPPPPTYINAEPASSPFDDPEESEESEESENLPYEVISYATDKLTDAGEMEASFPTVSTAKEYADELMASGEYYTVMVRTSEGEFIYNTVQEG